MPVLSAQSLHSILHNRGSCIAGAMHAPSAQPLDSIIHYRGSCIAGYLLCLFIVLSHCILSYTTEVVV